MPLRTSSAGSSGVFRSTPLGRVRSETEPTSAAAPRQSHDSRNDFEVMASGSKGTGNGGEAKVVDGLIGRIVQKLPCNSGIRIGVLETDSTIQTTVQALRQMSIMRLPAVVHSSLGALEGLTKYSTTTVISEVPLEVIQSQIYLLHLLDLCLTATWRQHAKAAEPSLAEDLSRSWSDPPPLEEGLARRLLSVILVYLRLISNEAGVHPGTSSPAPSRDGRGHANPVVSWGHAPSRQPSTSSFSPDFIMHHSYAPSQQSKEDRPRPSIGSTMVNTVDAVSQLTRHLGQIIYYLSSSNWPLVFGRVKSRLVHFTTTIEDAPDLIDLRLLQWSNFNRNRLGQVTQEASNIFLHIKRPSQIAFASVLHSAIWNWIDINPLEFEALVESNRRMDGGPDGLFDVLYSMSDFSSSNAKRTAVFYPLLSMLLVISPDLLKKVVLGDASAKSSGMSKKFSFMESLKKGMSGNKGFEPSTRCYLNFVKAAVSLSTRHDSSGLRTLLPEIVNDLKDALFFGPHSNDLADSDLPVEGLVALYRANPNLITSTVFGGLWLDSDISRTIAIKACATICLEQQCSPWYPPIGTLRSEVVSHIRQAFRGAVRTFAADQTGSRRPRASIDGSPTLIELVLETLKLFALDPEFVLAPSTGPTNSDEGMGPVLSAISSLLVGTGQEDIRLHARSAVVNVLTHMGPFDTAGSRLTEQCVAAKPHMWRCMINAARQVIYAFDSGDAEDLVMASEAFRDVALALEHLANNLDRSFCDDPTVDRAFTVGSAAGLIALAGPGIDQYAILLPALSALVTIGDKAKFSYSDEPEARLHLKLLHGVSKAPPATGRLQQQRQLRRVLREHSESSMVISAMWSGLHYRLDSLMGKMGRFSPNASFVDLGAKSINGDVSALADDEAKEWQNMIALLASITASAVNSPTDYCLADLLGPGQLPSYYEQTLDGRPAVQQFVTSSVNMLYSGSIFVREAVKDALGNDLALSYSRVMVASIINILSQSLSSNGINVTDSFTTLVEQSITVLRLTVERIPPGTVHKYLDLDEIIFLLARYLSRLGRNEGALRAKMRFCHFAELALRDGHSAKIGTDGLLPNSLLDWLTEWSMETMKESDSHPGHFVDRSKAQKDLDHACLRTLRVVTWGLVLRSTTDTSDDTPIVVKARLFQRYLTQLTKVIDRPAMIDELPARRRTTTAESKANIAAVELPSNLAIKILSNLLSANMDVGLQLCLSLGYHEDPVLRCAFIELTASVLRNGSPFGVLGNQTSQSRHETPYLDALVWEGPDYETDNLAFAVAICEVCPPAQVDEMLGLLFRSLETNGLLLSLIKIMVEKEVAQTNHESELFRANSITTKMLTVFGRTYGYNYVRTTLEPLIHNLNEKPSACSFELDPTKAGPNENIEQNAERLQLMCQALLDLICASAPRVPVMFRALCQQIWEIVEDRFPEACHSAIGSFIFLRFFCPAIVTPEAVDLEVSAEAREVRRALLMITKVIQNLANNVKFKEPHMQILNDFLAANIKQVTKYLSDIATRPRSWELTHAQKLYADEAEMTQDRDADNDILYRFVFNQYGRLRSVFERMPPSYRRSMTTRSARADLNGGAAAKQLLDLMRKSGEPLEPAAINATSRTQAYNEFMRENAGRDTDEVKQLFFEGPASQNGRRIFYFLFDPSGLVDHDLFAYHVFQTMARVTETFDLVFDLTQYSPRVDFPKFWLQRIAQMCPPTLLQLVNVIALYNVSTFAKKRAQRIVKDLSPICGPVGKAIVAVCSPSELGESIPFTTLHFPDYTMNLAYITDTVFTNLLKVSDHDSHTPIIVKLGVECLQMATRRQQNLFSNVKGYIVDVIRLRDIDDIVTGSGSTENHLNIKYQHSQSVVLVSRKRHELAHMIRAARSRLRDAPSEERTLRPSDVPGTLLNIALVNLSAQDDLLRASAYNLIDDLSTFFDWDLLHGILKVSAGMAIPSNSLTFAYHLSKSLSRSAPHLTLDFLKEWTIGFARADVPQKTACLQYVGPWIPNLSTFAMPSRGDGAESKKQVEEIIRNLISITAAERRQLHLVIQEHIWARIANGNEYLMDIVVSQLLDAAIDSGPGSDRAECVGEIFHSISSIAIRGNLVARLRKTIAQTYLKPSVTLEQNPAWDEICALARINLALSFAPSDSLGTRLYLPELIHIITLLVGSGPLLMRQTMYGLFINVLQSLASTRAVEEMDGTALHQALEKAQSEQILVSFGLVQVGGALERLDDEPSEGEVDTGLLERVEHIARFLGDVLGSAASSSDCTNAWRSRWMGLVVGTCFQHNPATQPQAITVLGYLACDEVDDDLVYQVLVSMSTSLSHLSDTDVTLLASMLRCLSRVIPGLTPDSRYATSLFWLAFAVAELSSIPLFGPALELMYTSLKTLSEDTRVERVMDHLLEYRSTMGEPARRIDQIAGISFDHEPSFSLVAILNKGFRHPSTKTVAVQVATTLLEITASSAAPDDDSVMIPKSSVPYFVALLPIAAKDQTELKQLFLAAGLDVDPDVVFDVDNMAVLNLLSVPDNSSAIFLVTLIVTILGSAATDTERLVLYRLLADASAEMPEVLCMAYDSLLPKLSTTLWTSSSPTLIQNATTIIARALTDPNYSFPELALPMNESQGSLAHGYQQSISSANGFGGKGPMVAVLDDLGMKGLTEGGFGPARPERLSMMAKWVAALIDSFTL